MPATTSSRPRSIRSSTTPTSTGARACRSGRRSARRWRPRSRPRSSARRSRRKRSTKRRCESRRSSRAEGPGVRSMAEAAAIAAPEPLRAARGARSLEQQERRFALALLVPALAVLVLTTMAPLVYLAWSGLHRMDLGIPWLSGFAGLDNFAKMGSDPRFWNSLALTAVYTASTVVLQVIVGLSLALLVLQIPKGQGLLRVAAILPIVLAPVVVGLFWRTLVLAPDVGLVDWVTRSMGLGSHLSGHNWLGDPQLALISVI